MSSASSDPKRDSNSNTAAGTSTIQLDTMSLDQLNTLKQREESRLQALSQRYSALRQAAARINAAKTAVRDLYNCDTAVTKNKTMDDGRSDMKDDSDDPPTPTTKDVFVPLTESVYVPGKIRIHNNAPPPPHGDGDDEPLLLIELGTGYFVEQNTTATTDYLQRKLNLVDANSDNGTYFRSIV
jgi:prefoldin subunit 5